MDPRAEIFTAFRKAKPGIFDDPGHILAVDNICDAFGIGREGQSRKIGPDGIALIKEYEGCELKAYPDPGTGGEPWTIGVGHTGGVKRDDVITQEKADDLLRSDLHRFEQAVSNLAPNTTQSQFDALVSLAFNIGEGNLAKSTLLKKHNAGDYTAAAVEFSRWVHAGGKIMKGLVRRRGAERDLYVRDALA